MRKKPSLLTLALLIVILLGCSTPNNKSATIPETDHQGSGRLATATPAQRMVFVCSSPPIQLDVENELGIRAISSLRFAGEDILEFEGWAERPKSLTLPTPTPVPRSDPRSRSYSTTIVTGQFNLLTEEISLLTRNYDPLWLDPCLAPCHSEILSQSPNGQWQLVQILDAPIDIEGIWVVGQNDKIRLVDYVPFSSTWQWAVDNSLLWYTYNVQVFGYDALIAYLEAPPHVIQLDSFDSLNLTNNHVAFSPQAKTILSIAKQSRPDLSDKNELTVFDLRQASPQIVDTLTVTGLEKVEWDETTLSYLLLISREDGMEIREYGGDTIVRLPMTEIESIYYGPGALEVLLDLDVPFEHHTLSVSGRRLAFTLSPGNIYVFDCQENLFLPYE